MTEKTIDYANSHGTVRISAKRFDQSPYLAKYVNDHAIFGIYANRFYPLSLGGDPIADYWKLRREAMLYDVPERPVEIAGPDASTLVEKVFTRKVGRLKIMRARYALACTPQGKIQMDGVLIRLAMDRFWYVKANGDFDASLLAWADGMDVTIRDPHSWVLQIQGPRAMDILQAATGSAAVDNFGYFHAGIFDFAGQEHLVTRTGWTGEAGFEVYSNANTDHHALWDHLMASGEPFGLAAGSLASMGLRRIEAGILDNGTDIDMTMTPFEAGLGAFVDLSKPDFVGRAALQKADQRCLLFGFVTESGVPSANHEILLDGEVVGFITAGSWSPTLEKGVGYVRFYAPAVSAETWLNQTVILKQTDGTTHTGKVVSLPFFDKEKHLPRGLPSSV